MAKAIVYTDGDNNELRFYENNKGKLYLQVQKINDDYGWAYIVLEKDDVKTMIEELKRIYDELPE